MLFLPILEAPVLIVWGDHDGIFDVSGAAILEKGLKHHQTVIMKDTGHLPMTEKPAETAAIYIDFLKKCDGMQGIRKTSFIEMRPQEGLCGRIHFAWNMPGQAGFAALKAPASFRVLKDSTCPLIARSVGNLLDRRGAKKTLNPRHPGQRLANAVRFIERPAMADHQDIPSNFSARLGNRHNLGDRIVQMIAHSGAYTACSRKPHMGYKLVRPGFGHCFRVICIEYISAK